MQLLPRNIAFPLLKRLCDAGDPIAEKSFKKEIKKQILSRNMDHIKYLSKRGYLNKVKSEDFDDKEKIEIKKKIQYENRSNLEYLLLVSNLINLF